MTPQQQAKLDAIEGDVLDGIRANLRAKDGSRDEEIAGMDANEMLERYLNWNGIIGYAEMISDAVREIDAAQTAGTSAQVQTERNT